MEERVGKELGGSGDGGRGGRDKERQRGWGVGGGMNGERECH